jgi:Flp pilus assembly protein TadD
MREGRFDEADAAFSVAHDLVPLAAAVDGRGCIALLRGEWEQAEGFFEEAYMMDQSYDKAAANLALLLDVKGEPDRARELYKWYLERHPDDAGVRNNMAALEFDQGGDKKLILQELLRAAAVSRHGVIIDNITQLKGLERETW